MMKILMIAMMMLFPVAATAQQPQQQPPRCMPRAERVLAMAEFQAQAVVVAQIDDNTLLEIFSNRSVWQAFLTGANGNMCLVSQGIGEVQIKNYTCLHPTRCPAI
jgi:hypothetical protein